MLLAEWLGSNENLSLLLFHSVLKMNTLTDHCQRSPSILRWHSRPLLPPFCLHLYPHFFPLLTLHFKLGSQSLTCLAFVLSVWSAFPRQTPFFFFFDSQRHYYLSLWDSHKSNQFSVFLKHTGQILTIVLTTLFYTGFFMDLTFFS